MERRERVGGRGRVRVEGGESEHKGLKLVPYISVLEREGGGLCCEG